MPIYFIFILTCFITMSVWMSRVIITLYALRLGAQPFTVGTLAAVMPTLLSWHVGRLSDRFGSRGMILFGTATGILGMLVAYFKPGLPSLFVTSGLCGLLFTASGAPLQNLIGLQSGPQDSARNFSTLSLVVSFTGLAAPLLAGFTFDHGGPGSACLTLALLLLVPAVMLIFWGGILPGGTRQNLWEASLYCFRNPASCGYWPPAAW